MNMFQGGDGPQGTSRKTLKLRVQLRKSACTLYMHSDEDLHYTVSTGTGGHLLTVQRQKSPIFIASESWSPASVSGQDYGFSLSDVLFAVPSCLFSQKEVERVFSLLWFVLDKTRRRYSTDKNILELE